jgi:hypothetical protein
LQCPSLPNCGIGAGALEQFSDDSQNLAGKGIQSAQCFEDVGTVHGITKGSKEDLEQEADDAANGAYMSPGNE